MTSVVVAGAAWLFCPADRRERYEKGAQRADVVILDLEDGVAAAHRAAAREALVAQPLDPARTVVRINSGASPECARDLEALARTEYTTVMLAKTEDPAQVRALAPLDVVALIETPRGVLRAAEVAQAPGTVGLMWGSEDLIAGLGGQSSRRADGSYRDVSRHTRSVVLLAAGAFGRYALDSVHVDIADLDGLAAEAADAVAVGFAGTVCIHPNQVPVVRAAYRPSSESVGWARRVLAAAEHERGVFSFEGSMVDAPLLTHASTILRRAAAE